ncbi:LytR C-terminal domain-containing protein [Rugamonas aquatica]|uniref:LytR/CpsA/Psr regulator C-terminal domain-containing protein n=1 Tax=Rugamonas aquatica TaxID=2743357 RepID=A0A6A7N0M5_9BURK|nr:LytR C-terminal domain-containing protein [Rugamonas aquatica]MQA38604.1 hypothetical protein [Rugamonas aquatica]
MMRYVLVAACSGAMLMACSGIAPAPAPTSEPEPDTRSAALTALERACLQAPTEASSWEQLGAALEAGGERERAAVMFRQAATLRAHDVQRDYALLKEGAAQARAVLDASMPRTEVRQIGAALVEVLRVGAGAGVGTVADAAAAPAPSGVRLEISNGNGITGAAARLARTLNAEGIKATRLTNVRPFVVPLSRIEYQRDQQLLAQTLAQRLGLPLQAQSGKPAYADMRIVLGHDVVQARYLK